MGNICPTCDYENLQDHRFCTQCGSKLETPEKVAPKLVVLRENEQLVFFTLSGVKNILGRDVDSDVVIEDEKISRKHAIIYQEDRKFWIEDLNSKNGVYLNGKKISTREHLSDGYLIKLGSTIFRFESPQ